MLAHYLPLSRQLTLAFSRSHSCSEGKSAERTRAHYIKRSESIIILSGALAVLQWSVRCLDTHIITLISYLAQKYPCLCLENPKPDVSNAKVGDKSAGVKNLMSANYYREECQTGLCMPANDTSCYSRDLNIEGKVRGCICGATCCSSSLLGAERCLHARERERAKERERTVEKEEGESPNLSDAFTL